MQTTTLGSIERKLKEIYDDYSANVTYIYGRQDLHLILDLAYHSPLWIKYDKKIRKGYPEILVIGDTRTGKTQCAEALQTHYNLGVLASGESCTFAGLVGGLQQLSGNWTCTWGIIPQNNRRLVIIDEAGGMKEEAIADMSGLRSSGIAQINKIQTQSTEARTRLIWLCNPRDTSTVNQYSSGVEIIQTIISKPEDIARWDAALIVSKDEIPFDMMSSRNRTPVNHMYNAQLARSLVLWAWTREPEEVIITKEADDAIFEYASEMCEKYCTDFTLVNGSEQRIKLARLSTALAARVYSTPDGKRLLVEAAHVEYIFNFLNRIYDSKYFKYDTWSANQKECKELVDVEKVQAFCEEIGSQGCNKFLNLRTITTPDIETYLGTTYDEAKLKMSMLLLSNAIYRWKGQIYNKTPEFNNMLREYSTNGKAKKGTEF